MLKQLIIKEAVDGVINLSTLGEIATVIIPPVQEPWAGPNDDADVYIGENKEYLGVVRPVLPEIGGELKIPKSILLKYSGNIKIPFHYSVFPGGGGNDFPAEVAFYSIVLAVNTRRK
ncbi:hypothetical protein [Pseudomonas sp. A34-9]|uniref:hypothetical protein n=1 Tax=Pseudomonas sp. A34-9 TaxID=3034675 RepID=UPI00240D2A48|nr:hypothetical protein [Pseudomonas sp. A34-9]